MAKIQRTSTPEEYQAIRKAAETLNETNDCAVVAVAIVCEVPYEVAHAELKRLGRKDRKGTYTYHTIQAIKNLGKQLVPVRPQSFIDTYPGVHSKLKNVTTHHPRRFPKCFDKSKTYLWNVRGHVLAVKYGRVMDWTINKAKQVTTIHEII